MKRLTSIIAFILSLALWMIPDSAVALVNGDRVVVVAPSGVKTRETASTSGVERPPTVPNGQTGKIISNSTPANGYTWWKVDWDNTSYYDGWSAEGTTSQTWLQKETASSGTIRFTVNSSFGSALQSADMNAVLLFDNSRNVIASRQSPTSNPIDFTNVTYGNRFILVYCWDMLAAESGSFDHASSITSRTATANTRRPLTVTALRADGVSPLVGATVLLDSYNGQSGAWTQRASGTTNSFGTWTQSAWPTTDTASGEQYRVRIEFGGVQVGSRSPVTLSNTSAGSSTSVTTSVVNRGTIRLTVKSSSGANLMPSEMNGVILFNDSRGEIARREPPTVNPMDFTSVSYGSRYFLVYCWDMLAGESNSFDHAASITDVTVTTRSKQPLSVTAYRSDGITPLVGATVRLDSYNGQTTAWTLRASGSTNTAGKWSVDAWPTLDVGEKYRVRIDFGGVQVGVNSSVRLASSTIGSTATLTTSVAGLAPLSVSLENINGSPAPSATTRMILYSNPTQTKQGNPANFDPVTTGTYTVEAYYEGTFWGSELWSSEQLTVSANQTNVRTLRRNLPYASRVSLINQDTNQNVVLGSASNVSAGELIWFIIPVKNDVANTNHNVSVRLVIDRDRIAPYDYDFTIPAKSIVGNGGTTSFLCESVMKQSLLGNFSYSLEVRTQAQSNFVTTDSRGWNSAFNVLPTSLIVGLAPRDEMAPTPVSIRKYGASSSTPISTTDRTWLIIHGRNGKSTDDWISAENGIAAAILNNRDYENDQILLLDWSSAATDTSEITLGENWIEPVANWAAKRLVGYGIHGINLNLIGNSWGGNLSAELAERISGGVNTIVALDPARDGLGSYDPDTSVNFRNHSQFSWAFHSSLLGSPVTPTTAHEAFIVATGLSLVLATDLSAPAHNAVIDNFIHMLNNGAGGVSRNFSLSKLLSHQPGLWMRDLLTTNFDQGSPYIETPTIGYEARIGSVISGLSPNFIEYYDLSSQPKVVYETDDTIAPTVTINQAAGQTDPTNSSSINFTVIFSEVVIGFSSSDVTLAGTAGASVKSVSGSGTTYNLTVSGMTQSGTVTTTIPAGAVQDIAGNSSLVSSSSDNSVTYTATDTTKPAIIITAPVNVSTYSTTLGNLSVGGTASDNVGVTQVTWSNDRGGSGMATGTINWTVAGIGLSSGKNLLTVTARDAAGNTQTDTLTVTYNPGDIVLPLVAITSPTTSTTHSTSTGSLSIGGTASDNEGVTQVTWSNDRGGSGTAAGTINWTVTGITLANGQNILTVIARDAAGNTQTATLTVTYNPADIGLPVIAITSPTTSSTHSTSTGSLSIGGTASDNVGVTQVTWSNDRGDSGMATGTSNWTVAGIALSSGQNILTVMARDAASNTQTDTLTVTYNAADTIKPLVTITAPVNTSNYATATGSLSLGGTASDSGGITQVTWSNDRGGSGTAAGTTSWAVSSINLSAGQNILTISGWDANGNIGTATLTVTYTPLVGQPREDGVTPLMVDLPGGRYFGISFNRLVGTAGSGIRIEGSSNLTDWVDATPSMLMYGSPMASVDGLREFVSFRCPFPISDSRASGLRFLRLNMTPSVIKLSSSGFNGSGQLGDGTTISRKTAVFVDQIAINQRAISAISSGSYFSLALTTDGKIFSWGDNTFGQLGDGTTTHRTTPVMCGAISGKTVAAIAAGGNHCLALTTDGLIYSWGYNGYGQLGDGTTTQRNAPVAVNMSGVLSGKTVVSIAAGSGYSLALTSDGKVFSWGDGANGTIGNGSFASRTLPVAVDVSGVLAGKFISAISAGAFHCLALSSDGKVFSWGGAGVGQLGSGDSTNQSRPVAVNMTSIAAGSVVNAIAAGGYSSIALTSTGDLVSWGYNIDGQVGDGTLDTRFLPVPITLSGTLQGRKISAIFAGLNHCVALTPEGSVVAWGNNVHGEYGNGNTISSTVPVAAGFSAKRIGVGSTSQHTLSTSEH